ncbi:hypothetical protein IW140_003589 [Coemansia sp. RSA 1813]|nr:hypothetical protein EV178_003442 [Coemansia sp. RSA 1646]KAJ1769326.1 hypothetical protein LPJ74_004153 [Coemansia sp. RSA 1843]KAJ2089102.1 hypothetical protein IW138_003682 [Coemansia sp. RSA 986]KAJ2215640.1 hypothetical protein EV179_002051 [Coemansia sp. RSA 487]KAJ2568832.1 hypothetical protein IW140_003589 [Coemansia sp. RSA 1813]
MKFAVAIAALVASVAADVNTMSEIEAHWSQITSIINADLPTLSLVNSDLYNSATKVIGGTAITQAFNTDLIQQVATGISPDIMNPVLSRAGITDVTLDGKPIPTSDSSPSSSASSSPTTDAQSSAHETGSSSADAESSPASGESSGDESATEAESGEESGSDAEESGSKSGEEKSDSEKETESSGAAKVVAGSVAAALVAVAALF